MSTTYTLDVRGLTHDEKHEKLFPLLDSLKAGETIEATFDFNPLPLIYMLGSKPDLTVEQTQDGPEVWVLKIEKTAADAAPAATEEPVTKEALKDLLRELKGENVTEEAKAKARQLLGSVDAKTLGLLEQELIEEGISHEEIRGSLCDIHLEAMRDSLVERRIEVPELHPVHTLMTEHEIIVEGLHRLKAITDRLKSFDSYDDMEEDLEALKEISHLMVEAELHHQREEDALFPRLKEYGITEPPLIMEEEHVEFRARKRALFGLVNQGTATPFAEFKEIAIDNGEFVAVELESHIFKEDNILYQIALQVFSPEDWEAVKRECDKIGYCCYKPADQAEGIAGPEGKVVDLDLRPLAPPQRHKQIFEQWQALSAGETLRITNDHDPKPLYYQFEAEHTGQYSWEYEQEGPVDWLVRIGRK